MNQREGKEFLCLRGKKMENKWKVCKEEESDQELNVQKKKNKELARTQHHRAFVCGEQSGEWATSMSARLYQLGLKGRQKKKGGETNKRREKRKETQEKKKKRFSPEGIRFHLGMIILQGQPKVVLHD